MNTGRVVGLRELDIPLSYTIEASFWAFPQKKQSKSSKKTTFDENSFMQAGAHLLSGIFNVTLTVQKLHAMQKPLL